MPLTTAEKKILQGRWNDTLRGIQKDARNIPYVIERALITLSTTIPAMFAPGGQFDTAHANPDLAALHQEFYAEFVEMAGSFSAEAIPVAAVDTNADGYASIIDVLTAGAAGMYAHDEAGRAASVTGIGPLDLRYPSTFASEQPAEE